MTKTAKAAPTREELLGRFTGRPKRTATFTRPLDPNDAERHADAKSAATKARATADAAATRLAGKPGDARLAERADEAEAAAVEAEKALAKLAASIDWFTFHLEAVPLARQEELAAEHPATKEQKAAARKAANGDPRAEPVANPDVYGNAIAAEATTRIEWSDGSSMDDVTHEEIAAITADWSALDQQSFAHTIELLCTAPTTVEDLGKG